MLQATIESIEDQNVTLSFTDGQRLRVSVSDIAGTPKQGEVVSVILPLPGNEEAAQQAFAKQLLNELIGREP